MAPSCVPDTFLCSLCKRAGSQQISTKKASFADELQQLALLTNGQPTDADADIDFAYRHMALPTVTPLMAPTTAAWQWYLYARSEANKFLEICAKREDAKSRMAGTITNQRMEDDKRQQFALAKSKPESVMRRYTFLA